MYTDKTWVSSVGLGAQFLPDYDEDGRSSGLKRQELFADISVDGRFREDCGGFNLREFCSLHAGLRLLLLGTPVAVPADSTPDVLPTKFTDVASAVVFAPHVYWSWWQGADVKEDTNMVHNAGPLIRAGMISREELATTKMEPPGSIRSVCSTPMSLTERKRVRRAITSGTECREGS